MEYRRLGSSGLQVSALSLGSWITFGKQIDNSVAESLMKYAYDQGINFFDNAEIYAKGQSEIVMGEILKKMGWSRDSYIVSSKVFWGGDKPTQKGLSRKHVVEACHAALKRLQVEYLDLYFCHRPDVNTPIEETVWTMHQLIMQGKILYWGTSEWSAQEITDAIGIANKYHLIAPVMEQPQYNMLHRRRFEVEYHRLFKDYSYGSTIWSPLASGILTGKYNKKFPKDTRLGLDGFDWLKEKNLTETNIQKVIKLEEFSKKIGVPLNKLALAWCLKNSHVSTAILGASKMEQLQDNIESLKYLPSLTNDIMQEIEIILQNKEEVLVF